MTPAPPDPRSLLAPGSAAFRVAPHPLPPSWAHLPGAGVGLRCQGEPTSADFERAGVLRSESIERSVPKRQREFLAGRLAAAQALQTLGWRGDVSLPAGEDRLPPWPSGIHGSISHSGDLAMSWVASADACAGIGLDVEMLMPPERCDKLRARIAPELATWLTAGQGSGAACSPETLLTLAFSAKESLFKALYPTVRRYVGFDAAELVSVAADLSSLRLRLQTDWSEEWRSGREVMAFCGIDAGSGCVTTLVQLPRR